MSRKRAKLRTKPDRIDGYKPQDVSEDYWTSDHARSQMAKRTTERADEGYNLDGFRNALTGIGDWTRDKLLGGKQAGPDFIVTVRSNAECEARWRGSDLGGRIVETIPDEMTREGWKLSIQPSDDDEAKADAFPPQMAMMPPLPEKKPAPLPEVDDETPQLIEELDGELEQLGCVEAFNRALCYERAYGGGAILVGADDGLSEDQPLDESRIKSIRYLNSLSGGYDGEVVAWSYYRDPRSPKYGMPEMYMVRNLGVPIAQVAVPGQAQPMPVLPGNTNPLGYGPLIFWVHESRMLVFPGTAVSNRIRAQLRGWGDSIFTRIDEVLSDYDQTWGGIANLMSDFSQFIIKVDGLADKILANNKNGTRVLTQRAMALQMSKSIARALLIDTKEEASRDTASLAGISDLLQQFSLRLAAAADMPVALLMGQAPAGLNATGASDIRFFYDRVAARQRRLMLPQLKRLIHLLMISKDGPCGGKEPARWNLRLNSLYQLTEQEQATLRKTVAETDQIYINTQVLTPEEVAASAYGGSEWTMERTIDLEGRTAMAEQDAKDKAERVKMMAETMQPAEPKQDPAKEEQEVETGAEQV